MNDNNWQLKIGLNEYRDEAYRNAKEKGFHLDEDDENTIPTKLMLMVSELAEALEEFRNGRKPNETYCNLDKPEKLEGIPVELADVLIRVFDFCGKYNIDIESIVQQKMFYNKTRPFKHGKKC